MNCAPSDLCLSWRGWGKRLEKLRIPAHLRDIRHRRLDPIPVAAVI